MAGLLLWALWARVEPSGSSPRSSSALLALTLEDFDWSGGLGLCQFVGMASAAPVFTSGNVLS